MPSAQLQEKFSCQQTVSLLLPKGRFQRKPCCQLRGRAKAFGREDLNTPACTTRTSMIFVDGKQPESSKCMVIDKAGGAEDDMSCWLDDGSALVEVHPQITV
mmetsp:Transcript_104707/g.191187  ORF Transcript_104707/g.191187 Transcript_104707/m.191187 type:complete len:102 (-) Transcript_104707:42-347(-)